MLHIGLQIITAIAVQPFAIPSESEVIIKWSTPHINSGCDGNKINKYIIKYNPVGSLNVSEVSVQSDEQGVIMMNINNTIPNTDYQYTVVTIDPNGEDVPSDTKYFTTQNDRELVVIH